jgi:hypothetical protein
MPATLILPADEFPLTWRDLKYGRTYQDKSGAVHLVHAGVNRSAGMIRTTRVQRDGLIVPCLFDHSFSNFQFREVDLEIRVTSPSAGS